MASSESSPSRLVFEIEETTVTVRHATLVEMGYTKAVEGTLTKWLSREDEEAYRDL